VKYEVIWERLEPGCFPDGEIANGTVPSHHHVLATGYAVYAGLKGLGRFVQAASGMSVIRAGTFLKLVIGESPWCLRMWLR
jgi:hypothetical protein